MFILPPLPYAYDALEPVIDKRTLEIHYEKHHKTYAKNLNIIFEKHSNLFENYDKSVEQLLKNLEKLPDDIRTAVKNQGGGVYNHTFFWSVMGEYKKNPPVETLEIVQKINQTFGSFEKFKEEFSAQAKTVFGSGWTWLVYDQNMSLKIMSTPNQDSPISHNFIPLLVIDVWEHAYYLQYQNKRADFINNWFDIINWSFVNELYKKALSL